MKEYGRKDKSKKVRRFERKKVLCIVFRLIVLSVSVSPYILAMEETIINFHTYHSYLIMIHKTDQSLIWKEGF